MAGAAEHTRQVLDFITRFHRERGYGPSYRDLVTGVGLSSISVASYHVGKLERQGLVARDPNTARSLRPVGAAR